MGSCDPLKLGMASLFVALQLDLRVAGRRTTVVRRYFPNVNSDGLSAERARTYRFFFLCAEPGNEFRILGRILRLGFQDPDRSFSTVSASTSES
jgi:hypothetical protein